MDLFGDIILIAFIVLAVLYILQDILDTRRDNTRNQGKRKRN